MIRMFLFYVDECGDASLETSLDGSELKRGVSPYFTLSAVGIRDSSRGPLAQELFELKKKHFGESATTLRKWGDTEIKGRFLSRAARSVAAGHALPSPSGYATLTTATQVDALVTDIGHLFTRFRPLSFTVVVDKAELIKRADPFNPVGIAYAYLHQRVALTIEHLYAGESAVFIADQQTDHEKHFRSGAMNAIRDSLTRGAQRELPNFSLIVDKPLWVDTELSSWDRELIQLADIVAYTSTAVKVNGCAPRFRSYLWPQIRQSLAVHWRSGQPGGRGYAVHPKQSVMPDLSLVESEAALVDNPAPI